MNDKTFDERAIADLLPFYATDRLSAHDKVQVAAALSVDPALRHELAVIREEQRTTVAANERLGAPSRQARERFFALLDAQPQRRARRFDPVGLIAARIDGMRPQPLAWSLAALILVVIAQAGVIGLIIAPGVHFETASVTPGAPGAEAGALVLVAFAPDAKAVDIATLLRDNAVTIVAGPLAGGLYRLRVGPPGQVPAATAKVVAALTAKPNIVRFAAPEDKAR